MVGAVGRHNSYHRRPSSQSTPADSQLALAITEIFNITPTHGSACRHHPPLGIARQTMPYPSFALCLDRTLSVAVDAGGYILACSTRGTGLEPVEARIVIQFRRIAEIAQVRAAGNLPDFVIAAATSLAAVGQMPCPVAAGFPVDLYDDPSICRAQAPGMGFALNREILVFPTGLQAVGVVVIYSLAVAAGGMRLAGKHNRHQCECEHRRDRMDCIPFHVPILLFHGRVLPQHGPDATKIPQRRAMRQ